MSLDIPREALQLGPILGAGALGAVYRASWNGTPVAVKTCGTMSDHEFTMLSVLRHPNINRLLGICRDGASTMLVLEHMALGDLMALLRRPDFRGGFDLQLRMAMDAAQGLAYLHSRQPVVIHRDIKSQNLLVSESYRVVLSDFGFSRLRTQSAARTRCGSPAWLAPEILEGRPYTESVDVFAFGVVLWELQERRAPYEGVASRTLVEFMQSVCSGMRPEFSGGPAATGVNATRVDVLSSYAELARQCWDADPSRRPAVRAVIDRLTPLLSAVLSLN